MKLTNRTLTSVVPTLLLLTVSGAAQNNSPSLAALNKWWQDQTAFVEPVKAGTVTPAHTLTLKNGKVITIPRHVQTPEEEAQSRDDAQFSQHRRAIVSGFTVEGKTVIVKTTLGAEGKVDAQELAHEFGGFVWANGNRHFGIDNIRIAGAAGQTLASRDGLGKVY